MYRGSSSSSSSGSGTDSILNNIMPDDAALWEVDVLSLGTMLKSIL